MGENIKSGNSVIVEDVCDKCTVGKQNRCTHAYHYHCDCWGNSLDTPKYCPSKKQEVSVY